MIPAMLLLIACELVGEIAREALNPLAPRNDALFFPLAYAFFLCEGHERLTGNINFQDNLLNVLLAREHPWDASREMRH